MWAYTSFAHLSHTGIILPLSVCFNFPHSSPVFSTVVHTHAWCITSFSSFPLLTSSHLHLSQRRIYSAVDSRPLFYSLAIICCSLTQFLSFNLLPSVNTFSSSTSHISCCSARNNAVIQSGQHINSFHIELQLISQ